MALLGEGIPLIFDHCSVFEIPNNGIANGIEVQQFHVSTKLGEESNHSKELTVMKSVEFGNKRFIAISEYGKKERLLLETDCYQRCLHIRKYCKEWRAITVTNNQLRNGKHRTILSLLLDYTNNLRKNKNDKKKDNQQGQKVKDNFKIANLGGVHKPVGIPVRTAKNTIYCCFNVVEEGIQYATRIYYLIARIQRSKVDKINQLGDWNNQVVKHAENSLPRPSPRLKVRENG